ncbi:hypothetical protein M2145_001904 [Lachnospiraceae bacterium PF1-21]|uniref:hypothetical protein n=1 Tax=Ohessyouella blattaphilus TaxID=2949333 RepID=UPI003E28DCB1
MKRNFKKITTLALLIVAVLSISTVAYAGNGRGHHAKRTNPPQTNVGVNQGECPYGCPAECPTDCPNYNSGTRPNKPSTERPSVRPERPSDCPVNGERPLNGTGVKRGRCR